MILCIKDSRSKWNHQDFFLLFIEEREICIVCLFPPSQCLCDGPEKYVSIYSDNEGYRKRLFSLNLDGNSKSFNPDLSLNQQTRAIKYNPKLEIDRSNFVVGKMLGSGNFGCVFEGIYLSLYFSISLMNKMIE